MEDSKKELIKNIKERYTSEESRLYTATIYEVSNSLTIDVDDVYNEYDNEEQLREEERIKNKELKELERLQNKYKTLF